MYILTICTGMHNGYQKKFQYVFPPRSGFSPLHWCTSDNVQIPSLYNKTFSINSPEYKLDAHGHMHQQTQPLREHNHFVSSDKYLITFCEYISIIKLNPNILILDIENLSKSLTKLSNAIKHYNEPILLEESLLCEILYKYKVRLKKNVEIKYMLKIKKYLEKCKKLNLVNDVANFLSLVPKNQKLKNVYLPTRQMFEYILVRIQGYTKLFNKLINLTKNTAKYMVNKLTLGHYWTFALCALSTVSRVWEVSHHIVNECCACYKKIISVHKQLDLFGTKWLSDEYEFPKDLRAWLGITRTLDDLKSLPYRPLNAVTYIISDDEDDEIQFMGSYKNDYIVIDDSIPFNDDVEFVNEYIDLLNTPKNLKRTFSFSDQGSVIDIESYHTIENNKPQTNDDVEIITVDDTLNLENDVGEIVDRNNEFIDFSLNDSSSLITSTPAVKKRKRKKKKIVENKIPVVDLLHITEKLQQGK